MRGDMNDRTEHGGHVRGKLIVVLTSTCSRTEDPSNVVSSKGWRKAKKASPAGVYFDESGSGWASCAASAMAVEGLKKQLIVSVGRSVGRP